MAKKERWLVQEALLAMCMLSVCQSEDTPVGHLEPFGGWKPGTPVLERDDIPTPWEFYRDYAQVDKGQGVPVIFRGAAKGMAAMKNWDHDEVFLQTHGKAKIEGVEYNLKETRKGGQVPGMKVLQDFLKAYNTTDIYMVSKVPKSMAKDINFLPCMNCESYLQFLDVANVWMGRGGSKSVIHYDDQDNINCMISGTKRFIFMHPSYKKQFEAHPNTAKNLFGWVDTDLDKSVPGYGAFFGKLDIDRMDLVKYPGWSTVDWSYADLAAGDCLYIPYQWYHQVTAAPMRSINVHIWYWRPAKMTEASCNETTPPPLTLADCTWGYEPPGGHVGRAKDKRKTSCRKASSKGKGPLAGAEL